MVLLLHLSTYSCHIFVLATGEILVAMSNLLELVFWKVDFTGGLAISTQQQDWFPEK
jgi:hypothetical protein